MSKLKVHIQSRKATTTALCGRRFPAEAIPWANSLRGDRRGIKLGIPAPEVTCFKCREKRRAPRGGA